MFDDDLEPKTGKPKPRVLDQMSLTELEEYIEALKAEIIRVEAEVNKKRSHMNSAAALFGQSEE